MLPINALRTEWFAPDTRRTRSQWLEVHSLIKQAAISEASLMWVHAHTVCKRHCSTARVVSRMCYTTISITTSLRLTNHTIMHMHIQPLMVSEEEVRKCAREIAAAE